MKLYRLKLQRIFGVNIGIKLLNIITAKNKSDTISAMPSLVLALNEGLFDFRTFAFNFFDCHSQKLL
jgi:hypothetical protein